MINFLYPSRLLFIRMTINTHVYLGKVINYNIHVDTLRTCADQKYKNEIHFEFKV